MNGHPENRDAARPRAVGKFLYHGDRKLYLRGVTYGPFRPDDGGRQYHAPETVARDFAAMREAGVNAVRTYTVPPSWVLDRAADHDLHVLVGLPWEQHVAFLGNRRVARDIEARVRQGVRSCAGHCAVLGYAIGNEVPSAVVRWHGHRRMERYIERLFHAAKAEDPGALVAYVNYPSTEYLELPFVDLVCYNLYLERRADYAAYLDRLQNLAGDKPLVIAETGLDSLRNGTATQSRSLDWQVRSAFAAGCAGVFVFAWTDEWFRGDAEILDWDFGLTARDRRAKPALAAVRDAFAAAPLPARDGPLVSVVVCTYRGARTLRDCLEGLQRLAYPRREVIVVNDGADAAVREIARAFPVRLLDLPHGGLSAARNAGMEAGAGSIIAYIDDDAVPDPHWLDYLVETLSTTDFAAVGGPNIPPATRRIVPHCIASAPGGPVHVLFSDREAEHIPGCNMAFRKGALQAIGGFDPRFRVAGDDVDVCWRMHAAGFRIGFHAGACVWHHRRQRIRDYWRQQVGYGRAEALLEQKFPARYSITGQPDWRGRIYGGGRAAALVWGRPRVYHGTWGSAAFQSMYAGSSSHLWLLPRMPEWYLVVLALAALWAMRSMWEPLGYLWPMLVAGVVLPVVLAITHAAGAALPSSFPAPARAAMRVLLVWLHLVQPLARLWGRVKAGLTPWRARGHTEFSVPAPRRVSIWSETWRAPTEWMESLELRLRVHRIPVRRGGPFDRWDLEVGGGLLGSIRLRTLVEEHGAGKQRVLIDCWPHCALPVATLLAGSVALTLVVVIEGVADATAVFGALATVSLGLAARTLGFAMGHALHAIRREKDAAERARPRAEPREEGVPSLLADAPRTLP